MGTRVLVIGAGIAGLSAASYLQRNGFDTDVFELHDKSGGLCTAWKRGGFTFDGCIHWLMGSGPSSNMHMIWEELGAGDLDYVEWDLYSSVRLSDGDSFNVYTDPSRLEAEMLRLGPEDGTVIRRLCSNIRRVARLDLPPALDRMPWKERLVLLSRLPSFLPILPLMKTSVGDFIAPLKSARLREGFDNLLGDVMDEFPVVALFMMLGFMAKKSSGYPLGGSLAFAEAIEAKYRSLGGTVHFKSKVDEIIVEGGAAVGLRGAFGEVRGDYVISAGDAYDALKRLLGGHYPHPDLDAAFDADLTTSTDSAVLKRYPSLLYVGLGLNRDLISEPHMQAFALDKPLLLEDGALVVRRLSLRLFHFDSSTAPAGKTSAVVMIETFNDGYWKALHDGDRAAYKTIKEEVGRRVAAALEPFIPGFAAAVETVDVSTPVTFSRYTNNWHGSYEGWLPTGGSLGRRVARKVPGLRNFEMVGQWVNPGGGLPPCGMDGRNLAKRLCRMEGRRFRAEGEGPIRAMAGMAAI